MKVSSAADLNIEKEQHKKALLELTKLNRENKELRQKNRSLETNLHTKETTINDLKARLEMKGTQDTRHQEKDLAQFQKYIGRNPAETSGSDAKIMSIIRIHESQKQKLEDENRKIYKELEEIKLKLKKNEQDKGILRKEFSQTHEEISKDFLSKIELFESENENLVKENRNLRNNLDKANLEVISLKHDTIELKRQLDNMRSRYDEDGQPPSTRIGTRPSVHFRELNETSNNDRYPLSSRRGSSNKKSETEEGFHSFKPYADISDLTLFECRKLLSEVSH